MKKSTYYFLCVITFGLYKVHVNKQAKKRAQQVNTELITSNEYKFKIDDLIHDLGTKSNITKVSYTLNNVIVNLNDVDKINDDLQKKYKINGLYKSAHQLILVFGNQSKKISEDLNKAINA